MIDPSETVQIPNAPWWQNSSYVIVKEDFTAEDEASVINRVTKIKGSGANTSMESHAGENKIYILERMVQSGKVVVERKNGRTKEVNLPAQARNLLLPDLDYIMKCINDNNPSMDEQAQADFLPSANGATPTNLELVK